MCDTIKTMPSLVHSSNRFWDLAFGTNSPDVEIQIYGNSDIYFFFPISISPQFPFKTHGSAEEKKKTNKKSRNLSNEQLSN